jgi:hypothetical protein
VVKLMSFTWIIVGREMITNFYLGFGLDKHHVFFENNKHHVLGE